MQIEQRDEEKRSKLWRIVTSVATVLIIVIAVFFLIKLFAGNPLEGTWISEDLGMEIVIDGSDRMTLKSDELDASALEMEMNFILDKDKKTISFSVEEKELQKLAEETKGEYTEEDLETAVSALLTTYDYSVDGTELTLTEREYGDQMVFKRQ